METNIMLAQKIENYSLYSNNRDVLADNCWKMRAHDIKNIASCMEIIAGELSTSPRARIRTIGNRLSGAVTRITELCLQESRIDEIPDGPVADGDTFSLRTLLSEVADLVSGVAGPNTDVSVRCASNIRLGRQQDEVFRIIFNLAINAVQIVNGVGGGKVNIDSEERGSQLSVTVSDTGPGLSDAHGSACQTIYDRDFPRQTHRSMGMIVAQIIAAKMGGYIDVVGTTDKGTVLQFTIDRNLIATGTNSVCSITMAPVGKDR